MIIFFKKIVKILPLIFNILLEKPLMNYQEFEYFK